MKHEMRTGEIRLGVPGEPLKVWELHEAGACVILPLDPLAAAPASHAADAPRAVSGGLHKAAWTGPGLNTEIRGRILTPTTPWGRAGGRGGNHTLPLIPPGGCIW